ncbi:MAG: DNA primase [Porticoccaceae bacterium]|nr:DNA primase [Porticoccaceae bacterium]
MAGRIPQAFVDDLLSRVDIVDFIHKRVPLKKAGKNYQACCPFHDEKTPSFSVNPQKQFYYCFGCGAGGNVIGFAMDYVNMGFPEAVEQLAGEVGMEVPREAGSEDDARASVRTALLAKLSEADQFYRKQLRSSTKAIEYLKNRGLSGEIARDFGVGVAPEGWDNLINEIGKSTEDLSFLEQSGLVIKNEDRDSHYDRFRDRIIFPIRDTRGRTIAFGGRVLDDSKPKYLNSPESPVFHKSRELYGLYECLQRKARFEEIVVVEGYMDVIALAQQGINNGVATLGTACGPAHLEKLFRHVGRIIFCFDGDEAGARAAERALHAALPLMIDGRQVKFLFLPSGEDPDTIVRDEGKTGFEARLKDAMPLSNYIMELAGAGSKLTDAESKSRAHAQVMPLINQLPRGAFRTLMEQEVLDRIGVAVTVEPAISVEQAAPLSPVNEESEETDEASAPQKFAKRARSKTSTSLSAHLISLLLQYPKLISLAEELASLQAEDEDEQLFLDLCAYLHNKPETTLSNLLGYWMAAEPEQAKRLTELASTRLIDIQSGEIAADAVAKDFTDTLSRWTSQQQGGRLRERIKVLGRIPLDQQSSEQKAEMRDLMEKLRALN